MDTAATAAGGDPNSPWMPPTGKLGPGEGRAALLTSLGTARGNLVPAPGNGSSKEKIVACP